nr:UDP-N-acetylglucosamine--dolichyl-phosphate N-acetylglucosaminephosphotransferase [Andalucia godoyi]|eukprot:ANDGO_08375.mRNA.1 UDP-N-acetylglucosamine--dolichyl-phosphate N-acetylglucosaminephosphotransferase
MIITVSVSIAAYFASYKLIPIIVPRLQKAGRVGKDLNKKSLPIVTESAGLAPAIVFLVAALLCSLDVSTDQLSQHNASLFSIAFMILLGFVDDVLDVPWRYKILLPFFASLPLLLSYSGPTSIVLPFRLGIVNLGILYLVYLSLLTVFCTNSINILAGINGLEVGQSIVIALAIIVHLFVDNEVNERVLAIALPFLAVSIALLRYNIFPSRVFVGDTYTVFAGMALACCGILGHFSKTLMLFFIPQILNFLYSLPQLFGFIHCERHRLPKVRDDGLLEGQAKHWNLVNGILRLLGPKTEFQLWWTLMTFHVVCCIIALIVRHYCSKLVFY